MKSDPKRELLLHMVATVVYRGRIAILDAPDGFANFRVTPETRSGAELLAHIGDLLSGSHSLLRGEFVELSSSPQSWNRETVRFFSAARELDDLLASDEPLAYPVEKFVQGPIGDALTHVGQLVFLRRIAGAPVNQEPYFTAEIVPGNF